MRCTCIATLLFAVAISLSVADAAAAGLRKPAPAATALAQQIRSLSPVIGETDAALLATEAHVRANQLAREYRLVASPHFHNFLVNAGVKKRGLCHHWARDLGHHLASLKLRNVVLRWGIARRGTLREHNAVVVTARGQAFENGIVLDPWRHSGRLFWGPVATDKYPWQEDPHDSFTAAHRTGAR